MQHIKSPLAAAVENHLYLSTHHLSAESIRLLTAGGGPILAVDPHCYGWWVWANEDIAAAAADPPSPWAVPQDLLAIIQLAIATADGGWIRLDHDGPEAPALPCFPQDDPGIIAALAADLDFRLRLEAAETGLRTGAAA